MVLYMQYTRNTIMILINVDNSIFDVKWPNGYVCDKCGNNHYYYMKCHKVYHCTACKHEESILANTIFEQCKLALNIL